MTKENPFSVYVITSSSSGKSTLVNALLQKKLVPSKNEACTAIITEVLDTDSETYSAEVYNLKNEKIQSIQDISYEEMTRLNDNPDTAGKIFFALSKRKETS